MLSKYGYKALNGRVMKKLDKLIKAIPLLNVLPVLFFIFQKYFI